MSPTERCSPRFNYHRSQTQVLRHYRGSEKAMSRTGTEPRGGGILCPDHKGSHQRLHCICACVCVCMCICVCACAYACVCACLCMCTHVSMHVEASRIKRSMGQGLSLSLDLADLVG